MSKDKLIGSINEAKPIKKEIIIDIKSRCRLKKDKDIGNRVFREIRNLYRLEKKKI